MFRSSIDMLVFSSRLTVIFTYSPGDALALAAEARMLSCSMKAPLISARGTGCRVTGWPARYARIRPRSAAVIWPSPVTSAASRIISTG